MTSLLFVTSGTLRVQESIAVRRHRWEVPLWSNGQETGANSCHAGQSD